LDGSLDIEIEQKLADMGLELPLPTVPRANLRRFTVEGADMVDYSGGKSIRGPQSTGVLWGRADLIEAAAANPNRFIGRGMKVAKEEIIGLLHALQILVCPLCPAPNIWNSPS
jgi:L-seryl-tRNA(Ser) seleniumtransferase